MVVQNNYFLRASIAANSVKLLFPRPASYIRTCIEVLAVPPFFFFPVCKARFIQERIREESLAVVTGRIFKGAET